MPMQPPVRDCPACRRFRMLAAVCALGLLALWMWR